MKATKAIKAIKTFRYVPYLAALALALLPAPALADDDETGPPPPGRKSLLSRPQPEMADDPPAVLPAAVLAPPALPATEPSPWKFDWGGYVHVAYRYIQQPSNFNLVGRNNGFSLEQARLGASVIYKNLVVARVSLEGASEDRLSQSFPGGKLTTRLRDAYITWAPLRALRVSVGQMVTPWDLDSMRSDADLPFVSRAVPVEGVQASEGHATLGLGVDRNLGISLHSGHVGLGATTSFRYALFAGNGNGQNQILNDNNLPAIFGRVEFAVWGRAGLPVDRIGPMYAVTDDKRRPLINLGIAGQFNPRTVGNLPDLIQETDKGGAADLALAFYGLELQGGLLFVRTTHDTLSATPDTERFGWWAHVRYQIPKIPVEITPGYRIASYAPRAHLQTTPPSPADATLDDALGLLYHTFGVSVRPTQALPVHFEINYTLALERGNNVIDNDRFETDIVAAF